ncbi:MAG: metalloregulator ArsR/SmtB family transcription factor [Sphaerochaetaceae bacterium]|nr:metalloregulator ArsR/SmtB family transcription factor [Sphaerochaetaceae bacterium]
MQDDFFNVEDSLEAQKKVPNDILCCDIADFFKVFGDSTRVKILFALFEKPLCVHDLALIVKMDQSAISHQLKTLKHNKLVKINKDGKKSYYVIDDEHISQILKAGIDHLNHTKGTLDV